MNTKRLITASIFSLISASTALAADVMIPHQPAPSTSSTIVAPTFSWTGLYLGVQAGGFSSKSDIALVDQEKNLPLDKEISPKLSGFVGGFYAGSNIDLGDNFIFGVDTDLMISGKKHTKTITIGAADNTTIENAVVRSRRSAKPQTPPAPPAVPGTQAQKNVSETPASAGATAVGTPVAGSTSKTSAATQSGSSPDRPVNAVQSSQAGAVQSNQAAATGKSSSPNTIAGKTVTKVQSPEVSTSLSNAPSVLPVAQSDSSKQVLRTEQSSRTSLARTDVGRTSVNELQSPAPKSASSSTGVGISERSGSLSLARSASGDQSSGVGLNGTRESAPVKSAVTVSASQPSSSERTVPSGGTPVLARSGSTSESAKASNGTSGAQHGGHHGAHGSGNNANPHGASHGGGHGSGAHAHGTNSHASRSHGGQNVAGHGAQSTQVVDKNNSSAYGIEQMKKLASELGLDQEDEVETLSHTFKQNWGGATRVRIGFAADRFMPYLAGGIAYGQFQDTVSISVKDEDGRVVSSKNLADETKTMIGYTLGGGVDFSLLDNVIVRAEYRYSDFGKKKFAKEKLEVNYKTNDFRVGVAYKF
ncbi:MULTISPECIES: porin [unclassified Bartonella]|uniref:porin n=1 Tax=unclassified Bartonella TaxID=2645622 RepID=UPI0035CF7D53